MAENLLSPAVPDLKQLEALLLSDPKRYVEVVKDVLAFGIYLLDREGIIRSWNLGAAAITGFAEDEVLGKPFAWLFPDAAKADNLPAKTLQFTRNNRHHKDEQTRRRRNGGELVALCSLDAVRLDTAEISCFVEVFTDVTEQKQREAQLYLRATRDSLTGVFNRGHFTEMATLEVDRARRFAEPLSLALLDLDHFKNINDRFGHASGDEALQGFARICSEFTRKVDFIGRLGGEEFSILLPRSNKELSFELLQRLRMRVMETRLHAHTGVAYNFTVSIGLATLLPSTRDLRELMRNADASLYKAKREGRNRVEAWFE